MSENYIQFINQFMDELKKCYSTVTSTVYQEITTEFLSYCKNKNVDVFNSQTALDYLDFCRDNECYSKHSYQQNLRVMNILTYFHKNLFSIELTFSIAIYNIILILQNINKQRAERYFFYLSALDI